MRTALLVEGMQGLGDNLHQRAVVRQLSQRHEVWLETPWPQVYHDLPVRCIKRHSRLRTQAKNAERGGFYSGRVPPSASRARTWYTHDGIRRHGGFLAAMCADAGVPKGDFSLPIPQAWRDQAQVWLDRWQPDRPLMLYRPLVERTEWVGCAARNPDPQAYTALAKGLRERFFMVSVADLVPRVEWAVSPPIDADAVLHRGELPFEVLAALAAQADLVWCSPGFMLVLAQAVRAPMVGVFGGHEAPMFYDHGYAENLFIGRGCDCFSKSHACDKTIDIDAARERLETFLADQAKPAERQSVAA